MKRALIALLILGLLGGAGYIGTQVMATRAATRQAAQAPTPTAVEKSDRVVAEAKVVPVQRASLRFETTGTVTEVLAREGDTVEAGQPLARLDARDLQLRVSEAEAVLAQAQANYDKLVEGATPEEIAQAQTQVAQAQAQFHQVSGAVTQQDLNAAQAQLNEAQTALKELENGSAATDIQSAQSAVDQAEANLQAQRDQLSRNKTASDAAISDASNALVQAQAAYAEAKSNWDYVEDTGNNPAQPERVNSRGQSEDNDVENAQRESYYAAFVQAEAALRQAEQRVEQAQIDAEQARKAELTGIALAEANVRDAQARLEDLNNGADADDLAAARARVAQAQANRSQLQGEQRAGSLEAAQAAIANAEANLAVVTADPRSTDLAVAQAQTQAAAVSVDQAKLALDKATLKAPIAGTIADLDLEIGELADPSHTVLIVADLSQMELETDDLTELQVVNIDVGDPVTITVEALPGVELRGRVARIKALGEEKEGDVTYTVTIVPEQQDPRLRWNMTVTVFIDP